MANNFWVTQAGSSLQTIQPDGTITTLTLPTGASIVATRRPKMTVFGRYVFVSNSPSFNLGIDGFRNVIPMCPPAPSVSPIIAAGSATGITGTFRVKVSFIIKDAETGELLAESPLSPQSESVTLSNQKLSITGIPTSESSAVNGRRLYRTTTNGTTFFQLMDLDGNTLTEVLDATPDAALSLASAPTDLASPPGTVPTSQLILLTEWKGRLWGVPSTNVDRVRFSSASPRFFAWPVNNELLIAPEGFDQRGVTGFAPMRDELVTGKAQSLHKIIEASSGTFTPRRITENVGIESDESVVVIRNEAFWLWEDGIYKYTAGGVQNISDGKVRSWFTKDDTFNRARFLNSFGQYNPTDNSYELFLSAAGSSVNDRWIKYTLDDGKFWGPHKTDKFTPTCAPTLGKPLLDTNDNPLWVIGSSSGHVWKPQAAFNDGSDTAIDLDITTKFHDGNSPVIDKYFGEMEILNKIEASGSLTITPTVGNLDASAGAAITHALTSGRGRLRRLGTGRFLKLRLRQNTINVGGELYGYEVPFHELGER